MRISELARRGDVTTATVKYYLREGLLPPGALTSPTQAQYDESHVARLRLIRALLGPGSLTIAQAKGVIAVIDDPGDDMFEALGSAQQATVDEPDPVDTTAAERLVARAGWRVDPRSPELGQLARSLAAIDDAGFEIRDETWDAYLRSTRDIADAEIAGIPEDPSDALRYAVLGTILVEPVLLALRRLAHQHASGERYGT